MNSMGAKLLKPGQCIVIMLEGQLPDRLLEADKALLYVQKSLAPYNLRARLYASPLLAPHPSGVFLFVPIVLSELKEDEVGSFLPNTVREAFEERGLISVFGGLSRLIKPDNPRLFVVDPVRDVIPIERAFTTIQNSDHALVYDPISFPRDLFIPKILAVIPHGKENGNAIIEIRDQNNKLIGSSKISEMGFPVLFDLPWAEMEIPKSYEENYSSLSCTVFSMDENAVVLPEELEIWFGIEGDTVR